MPRLTLDSDLQVLCSSCERRAQKDILDAPLADRLHFRADWKRILRKAKELRESGKVATPSGIKGLMR